MPPLNLPDNIPAAAKSPVPDLKLSRQLPHPLYPAVCPVAGDAFGGVVQPVDAGDGALVHEFAVLICPPQIVYNKVRKMG